MFYLLYFSNYTNSHNMSVLATIPQDYLSQLIKENTDQCKAVDFRYSTANDQVVNQRKNYEHEFTMLNRAIVNVQRAEIERKFIYTIANFYLVASEVRLDDTSLQNIIAEAPRVFPTDSSIEEIHFGINYWEKIIKTTLKIFLEKLKI